MKSTILSTLLLASAAAGANAQETPRFQVAGAAGWNLASSSEAVHLAVAPSFALNEHFSIGADIAYSYLPLQRQARGGGNRAYWGLATLTANALPSSRGSPYLTLGYGFGPYDTPWTQNPRHPPGPRARPPGPPEPPPD